VDMSSDPVTYPDLATALRDHFKRRPRPAREIRCAQCPPRRGLMGWTYLATDKTPILIQAVRRHGAGAAAVRLQRLGEKGSPVLYTEGRVSGRPVPYGSRLRCLSFGHYRGPVTRETLDDAWRDPEADEPLFV
jgi:hypothetical protein